MGQGTTDAVRLPEASVEDVLSGILREGAQRLLGEAVEAEVAAYLEANQHFRDERGHRQAVRNGHKDERELQTGVGPVKVRQCILIVMGATPEGKKELVAVQDGYRESEQSWRELLLDLKARGLKQGSKLAVGDGAPGVLDGVGTGCAVPPGE